MTQFTGAELLNSRVRQEDVATASRHDSRKVLVFFQLRAK